MTVIFKINEKESILVNFEIEKRKVKVAAYTWITTNYSLIRHLAKLIDTNSISSNTYGYVDLKRRDKTKTTLQRIIMEFYSKYDKSLKLLLEENNSEKRKYEVDHINSEKLDNRIENFQILTNNDNTKKFHNKEYQVTCSNEYILDLDKKVKESKQYKVDEDKLKRLSGRFIKNIKEGKCNNIKDMVYLDLSSRDTQSKPINRKSIEMVIVKVINYINNISTNKCTNIIYDLIKYKEEYIVNKILNDNLTILNRYRRRYKYINEVILKFNILDEVYNYKLNYNIDINDVEYNLGLYNTKEILYDLYEEIILNNDYCIKDDNILKSINISFDVDKIGRYKAFRIMYMLGLLKREESKKRMSFFSIPIYTEELLKQANVRAKKILDLSWKKIRYFMIAEEFGEDIANMVYKERSKVLNEFYHKYSLRAKEDIINFLKEDEQIYKLGYITPEEIFEYIDFVNNQRRIQGLEHNLIYNNFIIFIKDLLNYNTDTKKVLKELGFEYKILNKSIIKNIEQYQKNNINTIITSDLKSKKRVIVLKKLAK